MRIALLIACAIFIVTVSAQSQCRDKNEKKCAAYTGKDCSTEKRKRWLQKKCKKTCGLCNEEEEEVCADKKKKCLKFADIDCETHKKKKWLMKNCKATCGICENEDEKEDKEEDKEKNEDKEDDKNEDKNEDNNEDKEEDKNEEKEGDKNEDKNEDNNEDKEEDKNEDNEENDEDSDPNCENISGKTFNEKTLAAHNCFRRKHKETGDMEWDDSLEALASNWAQDLMKNNKFEHNKNRGNTGENLAFAGGSNKDAVKEGRNSVFRWYNEITKYDYNNPGYTSGTGHFTQVVWKSSTKVGCGFALNESKTKIIVCCNYSPPGNNINTGMFEANVGELKN